MRSGTTIVLRAHRQAPHLPGSHKHPEPPHPYQGDDLIGTARGGRAVHIDTGNCPITVRNTTFSGNTGHTGGAVNVGDAATIDFVTITGNLTTGTNAGLYVSGGTTTITNSILVVDAGCSGVQHDVVGVRARAAPNCVPPLTRFSLDPVPATIPCPVLLPPQGPSECLPATGPWRAAALPK